MNQKLQAKDFITIGVYTAIMLVVVMAISMLGFIPIFIPLLTVLVPLIGGIPFMLYTTKARKFGMTTIMSLLIGLLFTAMGHGIWAIIISLVSGLLADLIMKSGNYSSTKKSIMGCSVFFLWIIGNFIPIILTREQYYLQLVDGGYGTEYADALMKLIPDWSLLPLTLVTLVFGILGGMLGKKMLKKHFQRAGMV